MRKIYVSQFMQPRFPNLQAYESPMCVGKEAIWCGRRKNSNYNFTTLRGRGKDSPHTVYHKIRKEKRTRGSSEKSKKKNQWESMANVYTNYESESAPPIFPPLLCIFERLPYWKINQLPCAFVRFEIRCSCGCVWIYIWDCTRTCKHFQPNWHTEYVRW